ncbi:PBP1A family penicillin-binding protein [Cohnella faecalis]|uniref:PBP1A family penicillin-binding protein n=1 Tax=Cohnella faecalis TaxID=2315694 RepID=A0A398CQJ7_9BACL|nr:PBP1A family penicillin-binding protein [Cohnella faecalis]RIE04762.1 PBP1A family penicillin-binding protein [Cohnella faecalis]
MNKPETNRKQRGSKGKSKRPKSRKRIGLIWLFFVVLVGVVCAVVGYLLVILNGERILSNNVNKLDLETATIIVDKSDKQIAKLSGEGSNREYVKFNDIPKKVTDAFVATEDKRFYEHGGVDLFGIGRALVKDIIARSAVEGASTITQQVAKNLFLNSDKTLFRKGTEASIALALENNYSKEQILELYLNRIYFGKNQYGIKTAAKYYFGVTDLNKLETWQIATLAGIPKAPNVYNPVNNPDKSMDRRAVVLSLMEDQGLITEQEKLAAAVVPFDPDKVPTKSSQYQTYIDYVFDEAQEVTGLSEDQFLRSGYTIKVSIDTKAQKAMEDAFAKESMFEKSKDETKMQGAMVIMDQHDGTLVAMVGGRDYSRQGWNRVTKQRQPGSSFKPIVSYGAAIETGNYFPWSTLRDDKTCYDKGKYCPTDSNRVKYVGPIAMTQAIKESRNQPAVWLLNEIGVSKGVSFAGKLGIELDKSDRNLAIALGGLTNGVTPLEMVTAYGAFANGGTLQNPHSVLEIKDKNNKTIYTYDPPKAKQVMAQETSYYVTQIMQGVTQTGGTGVKAKISGRPVAGKTGTTQLGIKGVSSSGNRDVWFVGYTPEWTAAVWMGYDKTDENHYVKQSSGQAAAMFAAVMSKGLEGKAKKSFPKPGNVQDEEKLPAVSGFTAAYVPEQVSIELKWGAVSAENVTYRVYRKADGEADFKLLAEVGLPLFDDLAILPEQTFTYYVTAYQASKKKESEPSPQATVTVTTDLSGEPSPGDNGQQSPPPNESEPPVEGGGGESPSPTPSPSPSASPSPGGEASPGSSPTPPVESAQP